MRKFSHSDLSQQEHVFFLSAPSSLTSFRWGRTRSHVDAYFTPSRQYHELLPKKASQLDWVNTYDESIIYHANWRANLYFLLLIAYYNQKRTIQIESTQMQYGVGVGPHIQACHSSPFPSLIDWEVCPNDRSSKKNCIVQSGSFLLGPVVYRGKHLEEVVFSERSCLFRNSFLWHWNSMTVGCPAMVNEFDSLLEGRGSGSFYRKELLAMLNRCAFGYCHPIEGMNFFYLIMNQAFLKSSRKDFLDKYPSSQRSAANRMMNLQKRGTFLNNTFCGVKKSYVKSVLNWDGYRESLEKSCLDTQHLLLEGREAEGKAFIKRFT